MRLKFFIERPVLAAVISILIILTGIIGLKKLPVEQYPDMAPPTISVFTMYPGANAETVQKAVIVPLEEAINGVEGLSYITSTCSNSGDASIMVYFKQGTQPDMAAVNVQNRVQTALALLPAEVTKIGVNTEKQQNAELKTFALYSPHDTYDRQFLNNYLSLHVEPRIKRINGVGKTMFLGSLYSMRLWLKPDKMMQYGLVPSDIAELMESQNLEAATGEFGENYKANTRQYSMKYRGRKSKPEEFGEMVIRALPGGEVLRLKEVAEIEMGDEAYNYTSQLNGHDAAMLICYQTAGSNAAQTNREIDALLAELSESLPEDMEFVTLSDTNRFLYASMREVVKTLIFAIILVVLVVYLFLQDLRATLIPATAIFVSVIGTFAALWAIGFTLNLLTLFALVLAIGTVVDDAIVVVEAVQARFDEGERSPFRASVSAMGNVAPAILTSTLIFMAVFIPVSMTGGIAGTFYKQFGLTMAISVGISAINAFTLSPALCALVLRPHSIGAGRKKVLDKISGRYARLLPVFLKRGGLTASLVGVGIAALFLLVKTTKTGLIPEEDTGSMLISIDLAPGTSMEESRKRVADFGERLSQIEEIEYHSDVTGFSFSGSGPSMAMSFVSLRPWNERKGKTSSATAVYNRINGLAAEFPDMNIFAMLPPMIPGFEMGGGFELYLQNQSDDRPEEFKAVADKFVEALQARPEIEQVYSAFKTDYPQYWVDIDPARCAQYGTTPGEVLQTLSGYYSGEYISNFNRFSKIYRVMMQADPAARVNEHSLKNIYTRTGNGEMAPLSQFVHLTKTNGPSDLSRFNLFNSIPVNGTAAAGYSTGEALKAVKETAAKHLPQNYSYEFGGLAREEAATSSSSGIVFAVCLLVMYLILCALYESFLLPLAVILPVPLGLAGCFIFARLYGLDNNIYMQTGIIMLIGLLSKTAILITEYAVANRRRGVSLAQAAVSASRVRFRPILMTALTMIFGLLPLMVSNGVGAKGNFSLSSTAIGGMIVGTVALLLLVPALFVFFQRMQEKYIKRRVQ